MPDRLPQLRRQRALVQEQLDWIDREIDEATAQAGLEITPTQAAPEEDSSAPSAQAVPDPVAATSLTTADDDDMTASYRVAPDVLRTDVRKGCFLYFVGALLVLGAIVAVLYFSLRSG